MPGNERLAELMRQAGFLRDDGSVGRKVFARAVQQAAADERVHKEYTHTYVGRWLGGTVPRDMPTRRYVAAALGKRLGRRVGLEEIGFGEQAPADAGLALQYPPDLGAGTDAVARLLRADVESVQPIIGAEPNIAAWNDAALNWLVRREHGNGVTTTPDINAGATERLSATLDMFVRMDNQFGGGHARRSFIEFLRTDVEPRLSSAADTPPGQQFLGVAASAMLTAAWMSYDAGLNGLAQRYFIQALGMAESANDSLLAGSILDAMSHQATYLGRFKEAANLASAARLGTRDRATPTLTAHFFTMEARALARLGDASGCDRALSEAVTHFERRRPEDDPEWISYFDAAEMAAEFGHCTRDLGRAVDATTYATNSLGTANGEYQRSDFFATMVLADSYLDQGEAEEGCRVALQALDVGEQLKSARCATYLDEFRARMRKLGNSTVVKDFEEQAAQRTLWTPSPG